MPAPPDPGLARRLPAPLLSIQAKWTLRYALAMAVTLSIFAVYTYSRVERRFENDAKLVLKIHTNAMRAELRRHVGDLPSLERAIEEQVRISDPDLSLAVQVFDRDGRLLTARGAEEALDLPFPETLPGGDRNTIFYERDLGEDHPFFVMATGEEGAFVQLAIDSERFADQVGHIGEIFATAVPILLVATGGLGLLLARGSLRPVSAMTRTARRISAENLEERIPRTENGDELDELARTLNDMMERIAQSFAGMRRFTTNAAHQLRTPLAALRSQLEVTLEKDRTPEEYRRVLTDMLEEVEMVIDGVNAMLRLARSEAGLEPGAQVPVEVSGLLATVAGFFEPVADENGVELVVEPHAPLSVPGDPSWLHQLFANLIHNAIKYTPRGGRVAISMGREPGRVCVVVRDNGVGIDQAEADQIFERFNRGRSGGTLPGVGLGLTIAREIARAHGGSIEVASEPGQGSTFSVRLPLSAHRGSPS